MAELTEKGDDGGVPSAAEFGQEARWGLDGGRVGRFEEGRHDRKVSECGTSSL
jgi:hypothetical protein